MLKNGESVAGVTVHVMTEKIDAGDIVVQQELIVGENENAGQLAATKPCGCTLVEAVNAMAQRQSTASQKYRRTYLFGKISSRHHS
jgi:methionyl-tRNA formyltransferase